MICYVYDDSKPEDFPKIIIYQKLFIIWTFPYTNYCLKTPNNRFRCRQIYYQSITNIL